MATLKVMFRSSTIVENQGEIFYQIIHNRICRQKSTNYHIYKHEWDKKKSKIIMPPTYSGRNKYLKEICNKIELDIIRLKKIIAQFDCTNTNYCADDIIDAFLTCTEKNIFTFMEQIISHLKTIGKIRTSETYAATLRSFKRFRLNIDIAMEDIDSDIMIAYEAYLRKNGVSPNSSSFYMRNLRAVYNRAVEKELIINRFPFKHVYTGIDKTKKRALTLKELKQIHRIDLTGYPSLDFVRDIFLFSFYTRGMSFIDLAYLRKKDLQNNVLSYRRCKTGQQLNIRWEKCMQKILDKYNTTTTPYLLPIIKSIKKDERKQYLSAIGRVNRHLKKIGKMCGIMLPLTMYVARHSWASIAKNKNIPIPIISEGMGHNSVSTTNIYLANIDANEIDKANSLILRNLQSEV